MNVGGYISLVRCTSGAFLGQSDTFLAEEFDRFLYIAISFCQGPFLQSIIPAPVFLTKLHDIFCRKYPSGISFPHIF